MDEQPPIKCRLCDAEATGIYHVPEGCVCAPDPIQALCAQHTVSCEPVGGMWPVVEGGALHAENAALRRERDVLREWLEPLAERYAYSPNHIPISAQEIREVLAEADKAREGG